MSYPRQPTELELRMLKRIGDLARERDAALAEAAHWHENHNHQVNLKRKLSGKYGALVRKTPRARWRRTKKRTVRACRKVFGY